MNEEKVRIESSGDLYKLPINVIKNTKLYNFEGKYFDKIYEEALKIERSGGNIDEVFKPKIKIKNIEFEMQFNTEFGQRLVICGSGEHLGNWDITKAFVLNWSSGNIWRSSVPFSDYFEYKFVLLEKDKVKKWENDPNRSFCSSKITSDLNENQVINDIIRIDGKYNEIYEFNFKTSLLKIECKWKN